MGGSVPAPRLRGHDRGWHRACELAARYFALDRGPITLHGELGSGRRALARQLHEDMEPGLPFVMFDCEGATSMDLARETRARIRANPHRHKRLSSFEGTICLVNVHRAVPDLQQALRASILEWRSEPNRASKSLSLDARILATTELSKEELPNRLDRELAVRMCAMWVDLPPLRARHDDAVIIAEGLLADARRKGVAVVEAIPPEILRGLALYHWPGNILELRSVVSEFVCTGDLKAAFDRITTASAPRRAAVGPSDADIAGRTLADVECMAIVATLAKLGGNKAEAARVLGISRRALYDKIEKYGIRPE